MQDAYLCILHIYALMESMHIFKVDFAYRVLIFCTIIFFRRHPGNGGKEAS